MKSKSTIIDREKHFPLPTNLEVSEQNEFGVKMNALAKASLSNDVKAYVENWRKINNLTT